MNGMARKAAVWLLAVSLLTPGWAALGNHVGALEMVQQTTERVTRLLQARKAELEADPALLYEVVEKEVAPYFDFVRMSRLVLGKYWRRASKEERRRFASEFRRLLVRSYAASMLKYSGEKIRFLPLRGAANAKEVTVRTEVELPGIDPVEVDYSLYLRKGEWKVYDVAIDGVSLVVNYRTTFAEEIRRSGGLAGLIDKLRQRNEQQGNG